MTARLRVLASLSLSLAMIAAGCNRSEEKTEPKPDAAAVAEATPAPQDESETPAKGVTPSPQTKTITPAPTDASLAEAVASIVETEASYPAALDGLLDLVPAGAEEFVVVRDVAGLVAVADSLLSPMEPGVVGFASMVEASGDSPGAKAEAERVFTGFGALKTELHGGGFQIDQGLVVGKIGSESVVVYAATAPDALPGLLRSLGATGADLPDECGPVPGAAGYVMCSAEAATLAKYAPGKSAAALRAKLAEHVDEADIEGANVLARMGATAGDRGVIAVATPPGLVHVTVGVPELPAEVARFLGTGPAAALGLVAPGSGFYWAKLDQSVIESQAATAPFMFRNVLAKLTGELLLGNLAGAEPALVVLAGVSDPAPAGGLVALAGTQLEQIPKELPDGSKVEAVVESMTLGGAETQVLHVTVTPSGTRGKMFEGLGLKPEAWLFSAGGYAGLVFGGGKAALETVASYRGTGPTPDTVRALPKPLARGLVDEQTSLAMHVSLDGLQSPQVAAAFATVAKEVPAGELPPGITADDVMKMVRTVLAPLSGVSFWMAPPRDKKTFHVAVSLFGDPRTAEGKVAMTAMAEVAGGADPAVVYGALASSFASSDRAALYQARAGSRLDGAMVSTAILGMAAAVAIPALVFWSAAGETAPAMATAVEATPPSVVEAHPPAAVEAPAPK